MSENVVPVRVLVVEDESLIALNLSELLLDLGYGVIGPFATSHMAKLAADLDLPDAAIVDLNLMDGKTGLDLAHHLVRSFRTTVVIATANPEDVRAAPFIVLRKPYTDKAVEDALRQAVLTRTGERALSIDTKPRVESGV